MSPAPSVVAGPSSRVCCWRTIHQRADAAPGQGPTGAGGRAPGTLPLAGSSGLPGTACRFPGVSPWPRPAPGRQAVSRHPGPRPPGITGPLPAWRGLLLAPGLDTGNSHPLHPSQPLSPHPQGQQAGPQLPQHTSLREPEQCICLGGHRSRRGLEAPGGCATAAAAPPSPPASPSVGGGPAALLPKSPWGSGAGGGVPASPGGATPAPRCRPPPPGPP